MSNIVLVKAVNVMRCKFDSQHKAIRLNFYNYLVKTFVQRLMWPVYCYVKVRYTVTKKDYSRSMIEKVLVDLLRHGIINKGSIYIASNID